MDWEFLSNTEKTAQYRKWVEDPRVGGALIEHHAEKDIRVWLKDVPMKEYARSQEGIGHYVRYIPTRFRGPEEVARAAFGSDWAVVPDTVDVKPNHCLTSNGRIERYVFWGRDAQFKDLLYAALEIAVTKGHDPAVVITTRDGEHVPEEGKELHKRIAAHCKIDISYLHRSMIRNPDYIG
ncbi:hypothetical protein E1292_13945 [Nonomuraea deserti]|uniref:Uncharacterized protein n=1 Tax=Nonomuraea deserti TaxID=1848322 RepID=A0A4R4W2H8_9ACTN|nr:hypothetical protein [Nonomuraea deserti]TDD07140.1 hypothetical protein E1292_13945 [Nonomuraea deserti]